MPRPKRTFNARTLVFIAIGAAFMVGSHLLTYDKPAKKVPEQTVRIETQPPVAASVAEIPAKPDFAPPLEFAMPAPLIPYSEYVQEESIEPAWIKNAVPSTVSKDKPRIVIIIDDMGMDQKHTRDVMDLPAPLTLSFLPYADGLKDQTEYARSKGHELMVHVPMEPMNSNLDSGPQVLKPDMTAEEFAKVLNDDLAAFDGYVGINNHMGSKMTQDGPGMARVMAEMKKRGLLFIDSKTIGSSVAADEAKKAGIPYGERNVFLDHEETFAFAEDALEDAERTARHKGLAIAIGHPKPNTINALKAWLPTLAGKGIDVVPVSAAVTVPAGALPPPPED